MHPNGGRGNEINEKSFKDEPPIMVRGVSGVQKPIGRGPRKSSIIQRTFEDVRYQPGWSIPKLSMDEIGAPQVQNKKPQEFETVRANMITRFDEAVNNVNPKLTLTKTNALRRQFRSHENKLKSSSASTSVMGAKLDKMKNKMLGNISSELGFGYEYPSDGGDPLTSVKLAPARADSWKVVSTLMDKEMRNWSLDAHKSENRDWLKASASGNLQSPKVKRLPSRSNPQKTKSTIGTFKEYLEMGVGQSAKKVVNSQDKLAIIAKGFRKTLKPISSQDARTLIKTPPENALEELELKHSQALVNLPLPSPSKSTKITSLPPKGSQQNRVTNVKPKPKGQNIAQNLSGLMSFKSLLEIQSKSGRSRKEYDNDSESEDENTMENTIPLKSYIEELPQDQPRISEIHGQLQRSVKSIDQAAQIAEKLGSLMTKVAHQHNVTPSLTSITKAEGDRDPVLKDVWSVPEKKESCNRNPYNPITEEIKQRAARLSDVLEQAQSNLKLHSAVLGINVEPETVSKNSGKSDNYQPKNLGPRTRSTSTSVASANELGTQTTIQKSTAPIVASTKFEFVSDMSYADQLMLKKLRNLKTSWADGNN